MVVYVPDVVHVRTPSGVITRQLDRADIEASRHKGMRAGKFSGRPELAAVCDGSAATNSSEQALTSSLPSPQLLLGARDPQQQQTEVATPAARSQAKVATSTAYSQDSASAASASDAQPPQHQSSVDQGDCCASFNQTESTGSWRFRSWTDAAICAAASPVLVPMLAFGMGIYLYNSVSSACKVARLSADNCGTTSSDYDSFTAGHNYS